MDTISDDFFHAGGRVDSVEAVEALWASSSEAPDLAVLLADHPHWLSGGLRDALLVDQQLRWQTHQPWATEDYLKIIPIVAVDDDLILDLICGECRSRNRQGHPPKLEQWVRRFPHLRQRLERQFEVASWFEDASGDDFLSREDENSDEGGPAKIQFGDYELCEVIARGGMGVIYRARHRNLERTVALKMIRPERLMHPADVQRFKNETRIVALLDHPNIIPILDVGKVDGVRFFTMRMVQGRDLDSRLAEYRDDPRTAAHLVRSVASAIHYANQHGVLHRDLKPSNVLVNDAGVPYVVDFGLARHETESSHLTQTDEFLGTPAYCAPEQLHEDSQPLTVAADVYGLGAILYAMLTGQAPFSGRNSFDVWQKVRESEPRRPRSLNPRLDSDLEAICLKAMEKEPASRYSSANRMAEDLQRYLDGVPVSAHPIDWPQRTWRWLRRHPLKAGVGLIAVAAACGISTMFVILTLQLHSETGQAKAARIEADWHHRQTELAQAEAEQIRAAARREQRKVRQALYVADIRLADIARSTGDSMQVARLLDRQIPQPDGEDVRGFEWFFLDRQLQPPCRQIGTDLDPVHCLAYSPDGQRVAAAGENGRIQIFDAATGRQLDSLTTSHGSVRALAFTPDGSQLASVGDDGNVQLHRFDGEQDRRQADEDGSPTPTRSVSEGTEIPTHDSGPFASSGCLSHSISSVPVWRVAFLPDGKTFIARDQDGVVHFLDCDDGRRLETIQSPDDPINAMALASDGSWLATGSANGNVGIWDVESRELRTTFNRGSSKQIKTIAISPDGSRLATGGTDKQIQIWDIQDQTSPRLLLRGDHFDRLQSLAFSNDGKTLAACDKNGSLRLWPVPVDVESVIEAASAKSWQAHTGRVNQLAFQPVESQLTSVGQDGHIVVWDLTPDASIRTLGQATSGYTEMQTLSFTADGRGVIVPGPTGIHIWNVQTGEVTRTIGDGLSPRDQVALAPNGRWLAASHTESGRVEWWDLDSDRGKSQWQRPGLPCEALSFSPDSEVLAIVCYDLDHVTLCASVDGRQIQTIPARQCRAAVFSRDGRWLAFTEQDNVILWDWTNRRQAWVLTGHISTVTSLAFSSDSRTLASAGNDRRIKLWDPDTGVLHHTMTGDTGYLRDISFADNDRLISLDDAGTLHVWHTTLGQLLCTLRSTSQNPAYHFAVSPDTRQLALYLESGQVELLEISRR